MGAYDDTYFIMDVLKNVKIYAYGHYYEDHGGGSGKDVIFEKWNGLEYNEFKTVSTDYSGERYELVTLEKGRYRVKKTIEGHGYVNFDEWEVERQN